MRPGHWRVRNNGRIYKERMKRKKSNDEKSLEGWKSMFCLMGSEKTMLENVR